MMQSCPHCGCELVKPRSVPAHRRLFGAIAAAFHHWPEGVEFKPRDPEHLRAYLLVRIGHVDVTAIPAPEGCSSNPSLMTLFRLSVEGAARALASRSGYYEIRVTDTGAEVITPRSISFSVVDRREFNSIQGAVDVLIELIVGVSVDQLLTEKAA